MPPTTPSWEETVNNLYGQFMASIGYSPLMNLEFLLFFQAKRSCPHGHKMAAMAAAILHSLSQRQETGGE